MIRKLTPKDKETVLRFAYRRERENLFVAGSFNTYKKPFTSCYYLGYFDGDKLTGLCTVFKLWGSFVINAPQKKIIEALVDFVVKNKVRFTTIPSWQPCAGAMVKRLKQAHGILPKKISYQKVMVLGRSHFHDFSTGAAKMATARNIDGIVRFTRTNSGGNSNREISKKDRSKVRPNETFVLKRGGKIVSMANIHGYSNRYFQIGGVGTLKEYRGKGFAKQVVSRLCRYFFRKGLKFGLLFVDRTNTPAKKVYRAIGFKPVGDFLVAKYK